MEKSADARTLPSLNSFRDAGASLKACNPRFSLVRERMLYLGGASEDISDADGATLRNEYGIKAVIDTKNGNGLKISPAPNKGGPSKNGVEEEMPEFGVINVLGIRYCWISLHTAAYAKAMWTHQSAWSKVKMFRDAAVGKWDQIESRALNVAVERGSIMDTIDSLNYAQAEIREVFNRVFSEPTAYPILISGGPSLHSAHLLWILLLFVLEIPVETIQEDYVAAVERLEGRQPNSDLQAKFMEGLLAKRNEWVGAVKDHLEYKYGGVEAFLIKAGVTEEAVDSIKRILLAGSGEKLLEI